MELRVRPIAAIAAVLIVLGIILPAAYVHWLETRTIAALDMPFSLTALVFGTVGLLVFFITSQIRRRRLTQESATISKNSNHDYCPSRRTLRLTARFAILPSFGLLYAVVLSSVLIPAVLIFIYVFGYDRPSVGIRVQLLKSIPFQVMDDSRSPPLVVRVENTRLGSPARLYLNSRLVAPEHLGPLLAAELHSREDRVVYVEAGPDVDWDDAVNVIDTIRGAGAKVVLLTTEAGLQAR